MSNPPQTLSVKRKRNEAPVDALILDNKVKRQKSQNLETLPKASPGKSFYFRRLTKPNDAPQQSLAPPTPTAERRFHLDASTGVGAKRVFVEARQATPHEETIPDGQLQVTVPEPAPRAVSPPRKRPGARSAVRPTVSKVTQSKLQQAEPTEDDVRELEALSRQVEKEDNLHIPLSLPSKYKPKPPAQRFADRHPEKATALALQEAHGDGDAMDIDTDEYVYDTYIREAIMPDADGKLPEPVGTVGFLVINEEDEDWWNGEDESDKEFDTDDDDENAEDYYANDYPEDELSEDDEFGRDVYQKKFRHGSDDEEYDMNEEEDVIGSGEDEDDLHFKMTVPKAQRVGYWGTYGE